MLDFSNSKILIVGDVMLDKYYFGKVDRISPEAPVPIVNIQKEESRLGGASNVANNIVSLGGHSLLCGVIGHDLFGKEIERISRHKNIDTFLLKTSSPTITKARIIGGKQQIVRVDYDGKIPDTMEELLTLPGVGRKTANLILGDVYGQPAIVTDTHFIRITGRLGLTTNKEPAKVERDLRPLIPPERSSDFCHRIVQFGRDICRARKPLCGNCPMADFCPSREA